MNTAQARKMKRTGRLNIRATEHQERLIRSAAGMKGVSMSAFVLDSACLQAEHALADQREFVVPAENWKAFVAALDRPAQIKPGLVRLFREVRGKKHGPRK